MRVWIIFLFTLIGVFIIDQNIKTLFVEGYYLEGDCIDLELHFNKGVAFSMFAFLGDYLKWIQITLVVTIFLIVLKENYLKRYAFAVGLILGGAIGNVYDRFIYDGVVDYVAWHCEFDFAVFNFADVAIDFAIAVIILQTYIFKPKEEEK